MLVRHLIFITGILYHIASRKLAGLKMLDSNATNETQKLQLTLNLIVAEGKCQNNEVTSMDNGGDLRPQTATN